jgi:phosphoglucosamine mutase
MAPRFGTDGVRGVANTELTPDYTLALGRAAARVLGGSRVLIGRDTRRSGPLLESALAAGFAAEGVDVSLLGVLPTPGVAHLAAAAEAPAAVITASHNPFADNGVKLFAAGGRKLPDDVEARIETELAALGAPTAAGREVGAIGRAADAAVPYVEHLVAAVPSLAGLHVVLDCAHGATHRVAPDVFERVGAEVTLVGAAPDGLNINDGCGATHPESLAATVVASGAHVGLAFDGDGDRLIALDHTGAVVNGDRLLALFALDRRTTGRLPHHTVVVTVMTNLGFHRAMRTAGIAVAQTAVGDRYVLEALDAGGYSLGGEQSGHIIMRDLATTGDGILAGLHLCDLVQRAGRPLADLGREVMEEYPQVLVNVRVAERHPDIAELVADEVAAEAAGLGDDGRILIRPSGTEPLIRVMVEADTDHHARAVADRLAGVIAARFG